MHETHALSHDVQSYTGACHDTCHGTLVYIKILVLHEDHQVRIPQDTYTWRLRRTHLYGHTLYCISQSQLIKGHAPNHAREHK